MKKTSSAEYAAKLKLYDQYGVAQKEYAMVLNELLKKTEELKNYFDLGYE